METSRRRPFAFSFVGGPGRAEERPDLQQLHDNHHHKHAVRYLLAAALVLLALPARSGAETVNQRAEREARVYFASCTEPDPRWVAWAYENRQKIGHIDNEHIEYCRERQAEFADEYVRAKAGDLEAMRLVALDFYPVDIPAMWELGEPIKPDPVQMCAWETVRAALDRGRCPRADAARDCGRLTSSDQVTAAARAQSLLVELRSSPAQKRPPKDRMISSVPAADGCE